MVYVYIDVKIVNEVNNLDWGVFILKGLCLINIVKYLGYILFNYFISVFEKEVFFGVIMCYVGDCLG